MSLRKHLHCLDIAFHSDEGSQVSHFKPGETVTGEVVFKLRRPMDLRKIYLRITGGAKVNWKIQLDSSGKLRSVTAEEIYIKELMPLWSPTMPSEDVECLPAYVDFTFPFGLNIPENASQSVTSPSGNIDYTCQAIVEGQMTLASKKRSFVVLQELDLTRSEFEMLRKPKRLSELIGVPANCRGMMTVSLDINKGGFVPGEEIRYNTVIRNNSNCKFGKVAVQLQRVVTCYGNVEPLEEECASRGYGLSGLIAKDIHVVAEEDLGKMRPREVRSVSDRRLLIPNGPLSDVDGACKCIDVQYRVTLELKSDDGNLKFPIDAPSLSLSICVGSVPVPAQDEQRFLENLPAAPPSYNRVSSSLFSPLELELEELLREDEPPPPSYDVSLQMLEELEQRQQQRQQQQQEQQQQEQQQQGDQQLHQNDLENPEYDNLSLQES